MVDQRYVPTWRINVAASRVSTAKEHDRADAHDEVGDECSRACVVLRDTLPKEEHHNVECCEFCTKERKFHLAREDDLHNTDRAECASRAFEDRDDDEHRRHLPAQRRLCKVTVQPREIAFEVEDFVEPRLEKADRQEGGGQDGRGEDGVGESLKHGYSS
jgi:hypothetical protein